MIVCIRNSNIHTKTRNASLYKKFSVLKQYESCTADYSKSVGDVLRKWTEKPLTLLSNLKLVKPQQNIIKAATEVQ